MSILIPEPWLLFCICFAAMLLATFLMGMQSRHFRTIDPVMKKFTIMDFEFPSKAGERNNLVKGIFRQSVADTAATVRAFRQQMLTDFFLFMPGAYGAIFILCLQQAAKSSAVGRYYFTVMAFAQILCFVLDAVENVYFWRLLKKDAVKESEGTFRRMRILEYVKWGFALAGGMSGLSAVAWSWLSGNFASSSLPYAGVFAAEIILFLLAGKAVKPAKPHLIETAPSLN